MKKKAENIKKTITLEEIQQVVSNINSTSSAKSIAELRDKVILSKKNIEKISKCLEHANLVDFPRIYVPMLTAILKYSNTESKLVLDQCKFLAEQIPDEVTQEERPQTLEQAAKMYTHFETIK